MFPDPALPTSPLRDALHAFLAATWCQRVLTTVNDSRTGTPPVDIAAALDRVDELDPLSPRMAAALSPPGDDLLRRLVLSLKHRQTGEPADALSDEAQLCAWLRSQVMDVPVAWALVQLRCTAPVADWLTARLSSRGWLPPRADRDAGQAFVLDWVDLHAGADPYQHQQELLADPRDPRLREPAA